MPIIFKLNFWKKFLKWFFCCLIYYCGLCWLVILLRNKKQNYFIIIVFHRVGEVAQINKEFSLPMLFINKENFEKVIKFLKSEYNIISFEKLIHCLKLNELYPSNSIIITFDDGYYDFYRNAYPLISKYNVPVTLFLTSSYIGTNKTFWWDKVFCFFKIKL